MGWKYDFDKEKNKSGVYKITNLINGKIYIGSSSNIYSRWLDHMRRFKNNKNSRYLQNAWNKYGEENFKFYVIEYTVKDRNILVEREQYWIDKEKSTEREYGYNIAPNAYNFLGIKWTEESKKKLSQSKKGINKGIKRPKEVGEKVSKAKKGKKRLDMQGSNHYNAKLTEEDVINIKNQINSYVKIKDIASQFNCDVTIIYDIKNGTLWSHVLPELDLRHIKHPSGKLHENDVIEIKKLLKNNEHTNKEIGVMFNVSHGTISDIKRGYSWSRIEV